MNAGLHIYAGGEYELNMNLSVVGGIGYDQDFFDVTKDLKDVYQAEDRSGLRMFSFRFGIKF
jgi:long-subunit fatty acid transport protein